MPGNHTEVSRWKGLVLVPGCQQSMPGSGRVGCNSLLGGETEEKPPESGGKTTAVGGRREEVGRG